MTDVDVTVVIPTRDRWQLLSRRSLAAALRQEHVAYEVVVVDDGSSDGTPERLEALADERLRVLRSERPGRVARARNLGVAAARGEWVAFLDDDDSWAPHKLSSQLAAVRSAGADFAYAGVVTVDAHGRALHVSAPPAADRLRDDVVKTSAIPAGPSNVLARTALVRQLGGFDEQFVNLEDWDLWIRLAWAGRAVAVPETLVSYLEHVGGKSVTPPREAFAEFEALERKHEDLRQREGVRFDHAAFAHYVAWLQLRRRRHAVAAGVYLRSAIRNRKTHDALVAARFAARALLPTRLSLRGEGTDPNVERPGWLDLDAPRQRS